MKTNKRGRPKIYFNEAEKPTLTMIGIEAHTALQEFSKESKIPMIYIVSEAVLNYIEELKDVRI